MQTPTPLTEFAPFPKIPRFSRDIIITEKIDGTNACVVVWDAAANDPAEPMKACGMPGVGFPFLGEVEGRFVAAQSRTRFITPDADNYGFAAWVKEHASDLVHLGPGRHFGEWWGKGINRNYGLADRQFSLFNVSRWDQSVYKKLNADKMDKGKPVEVPPWVPPPLGCEVVPVLYHDAFYTDAVRDNLECLRLDGSVAAPGYMNPEGIVIFHTASGHLYKKTVENDEKPKGAPCS